MLLKEFIRLCSKVERETLCKKCGNTTIAYLRKLDAGGKCSIAKAYQIELATAELAAKNPKLQAIDGACFVSDRRKYQAFIASVKKAA